jgi:hypothetical protein
MNDHPRLPNRSIEAELQPANKLFAQTRHEARQMLIRAMALADGVQTRPPSVRVVGSFVTDLAETSD